MCTFNRIMLNDNYDNDNYYKAYITSTLGRLIFYV